MTGFADTDFFCFWKEEAVDSEREASAFRAIRSLVSTEAITLFIGLSSIPVMPCTYLLMLVS